MGLQRFYANPKALRTHPNGAVAYAPGGPMDCLGHYAKVVNCPIEGTFLRRTCYATGFADTAFSVPAVCKVRGRMVRGFFSGGDEGVVFVAMSSEREHLRPYYDAFEASKIVEEGL